MAEYEYQVLAVHPNGQVYQVESFPFGVEVTPEMAESAVNKVLAIGGSPKIEVVQLVENGGVDGNI